jgi:HSP20 family protein
MSTRDHLLGNVSNWWQHVSEGWQSLRQRAGKAVTRFTPNKTDVNAAGLPVRGIGWALLPVDVRESKKNVVVQLEVPGLDEDDITIEQHGQQLYISGEKRYEKVSDEGHYYFEERAYGRFQRSVPLPAEVYADDARARYKHGVLTVTLPKKVNGGARRIAVSS